MDVTTSDKSATEKREPLEGQALVDFVAGLVRLNYSALAIARKASVPYARARKLRDQILRAESRALMRDLTPDEKTRLKRRNLEYLCAAQDASQEAYERSVERADPNPRHLNAGITATTRLNAMCGFDAPTRVETTDLRVYAAVRPEDTERVLADPKARAAMLAYEEAVSAATQGQAIDVTPSGGGAA